MVLEKIQKENDIKKLTPQELALLKDEIRQFLIGRSSGIKPRQIKAQMQRHGKLHNSEV